MKEFDFRKSVNRTWQSGISKRDQTLNAALGIGGESGEVLDEIKKWAFHGKDLNREKVYEEIGDVLYYIQALCLVLGDGQTFEDLFQGNSDKLKKRHPKKFDPSYHTSSAEETEESTGLAIPDGDPFDYKYDEMKDRELDGE